jgi:Tol biopolymer transport system component
VIDIDGSDAPAHLDSDNLYWVGAPQWSPAGDRIIFSWAAPGWPHRSDLWIMNPDGTDALRLTQDISVSYAHWSPDGKWVAFDGLAIYEAENPPWNLWLIDPVSAEVRRLTYGPHLAPSEFNSNWSPDGTQLVFARPSSDDFHDIWVISLLDGNERMLLGSILIRDDGLVIGP